MVFDFLKKQFVDVVEWDWQDDDILMWKYPFADNEIQNGASLTVRDGQVAMFINEGKIADVFTAGNYTLSTQTLPLLTNLKNWDKAFASPFKSDVLFFNTRQQQGRKWGTAQPVTVRDSDFGMVRLRAFGMYGYKITDVEKFYKEITGVDEDYRSNQIEPQLRNLINANLANALGNSNKAFVDLASNQLMMGEEIKHSMQSYFADFGLTLENIIVENFSIPEELQKVLDKRISMGMLGDMDKYTQYQTAEAITMAAQNEGGLAGMGASMGVGMNMGQVMADSMGNNSMQAQQQMQQQQMQQQQQMHQQQMQMQQQQMQAQALQAQAQQAQQPPQNTASAAQPNFSEKLSQLQNLLEQGLISQADYDNAKTQVLASLTQ